MKLSQTARLPSAVDSLLDDSDAQADSSMILARKAAAFRSSLTEGYFKAKHRIPARPADNAELVALRKKAGEMGRDFQALLTAHERQEAAVSDLRQKVRQLRQELEGRDKALDLARRTVERLTSEKGALEAGAAGTQAYVRKLESRLLSVKHAAELQQRCARLKAEADSLAHALHEAEARAAAAEAARGQSELDVACLKRGLELAAEQLTKSVGAEVPGTLLKAVARGQEEALGLSVQLSDARQQVAALTAALEQAQAHLKAQQATLAQQQSDRHDLRQRAEGAEAALEKQRATTSELRCVLDSLRPKAGALAEERESLRQQLELEQTAAAEAQKEAKQLRAALRQKAATEAALRDELRRALAGEGLTPNPASRPASRFAAAQEQRQPWQRAGSRPDSGQQQRQRPPLAAGAGRRAGAGPSPLAPGGRAAQKPPLVRPARPQQPAERQLQGEMHAAADMEPSPSRALSRLREQRRAAQGGRALLQEQDPALDSGSWDLSIQRWQQEEEQAATDAAGQHAEQHRLGQQQEAADGAFPAADQLAGLHARKPAPLQLPGEQPPSLAAVLPVQDERLMRLYTSALDEQIATLETDLAQLAGSASPIAQLQQQHAAKAAAAPPQQQPGRQAGGEEEDSIGAWRPNGMFQQQQQQAAAPEAQPLQRASGMQQLMSPGGDVPVHVWHSNPLAASPPLKQRQQPAAAPEAAALQDAAPADDGRQQQPELAAALAGRAAVPALPEPADAILPGASPAQTEEWLWGQLQQVLSPVASQAGPLALPHFLPTPLAEPSASAAASSPSLRLPVPAAGGAGEEEQRERGASSTPASGSAGSSSVEAAGQAQQEARDEQQAAGAEQRPAASEGSGDGEGVASLSHHWDLPSPGAGNSDWLSHEVEPDIEQLEVNSSLTPQRLRHAASVNAPMTAAAAAEATALAGSSSGFEGADAHGPKRAGSRSSSGGSEGGGWVGEWGEGAPLLPPAPPAQQLQLQHQGSAPLLPGLAVVPRSPLLASSAAAPAAAPMLAQPDAAACQDEWDAWPPPPEAQQAQQAQRTLFDLADMDLHELLS